ncbi:hypothetical protein GQR58_026448 [Nymphon striatum]|nr:hypothetical protein GQR58_026448 [Nymphon striatum]
MTSHSKMELVDWRRKSIKKEPEFDIEQNAATADFALGWLPLEIQTVKEENEDSPSSVFEQQCAGSTKENDNNELYEDALMPSESSLRMLERAIVIGLNVFDILFNYFLAIMKKSNNNFSTPESISHSESVVEPEKVESQGTRDGHGRCLCSKTKDGVKNKETIKKSVGLQLRMTLKGIGMDMDGVCAAKQKMGRCHNNANILNLLNTFYAFWEIFVILHGAVHIMDFTLQRLLLEGKIQGRRGRGRPRTAWYHNIKEWTGMRYADCSRKAQNREEWRSITANLLKADGTEDR